MLRKRVQLSGSNNRTSSGIGFDQFVPYRVEAGEMDLIQVIDWYRPVEAAMTDLGLVNEFGVYERLLDFLVGHPHQFDVRPLAELLAPLDGTRARVCLRHDVDSLIPPALCAAKALASRGLVGSFYFLHTAKYYGDFAGKVFRRNRAIASVLSSFREFEQEIGLHIDPLHVYFAIGVDGREAVLTEITWMRSCGVDLKGVVAHNSAPVYGAENFEILEGLALQNRRHLTYNGMTVQLQSISWEQAQLTYEGNFPQPPDPDDGHLLGSYLGSVPHDSLRRSDWLCVYLQHNPVFSRPNDVNIWLLGNNTWAIAERLPKKRFLFNISNDDVIEYLSRYRFSGSIVIAIHPEYLSKSN